MSQILSVGEKAPAFDLPNQDGNNVKLGDYAGKWLVVYFYPRDDTPGCTVEADEFSKDYKKFQKLGIDIIGISKDDVESHKKFCKKMSIPYILLADTTTKVSKLFGVWGKKKFMGKEYMGINRSTFLINKKGKIFKVFEKVKPKGHSKEVLDAYINAEK